MENYNNNPISNKSETNSSTFNKKNSFAKGLLENFEMLAFAVFIALVIFTFGFRLCTVVGSSMYDTLEHNDKVIVSNIFYTPERNDIIVFHQTGAVFNEPLVKRVIATEGEWVDIDSSGIIRIANNREMNNAITLNESYVSYIDPNYYSSYYNSMEFPVQVPEGHIFVLGDNRNHSSDSRSAAVGFVDTRRVLGKVLFRISPFEKIEN